MKKEMREWKPENYYTNHKKLLFWQWCFLFHYLVFILFHNPKKQTQREVESLASKRD